MKAILFLLLVSIVPYAIALEQTLGQAAGTGAAAGGAIGGPQGAAIGAGIMSVLWFITHWRRKRRESKGK